ncbi:MAG: POTRA domain-containing protein, partial [Acidobacteriota bacterium]
MCAKRTALDGIIEEVEFRPGPTLVSNPKLVTRILAALLWSVCLPCATGQFLSPEDRYDGRRIASISYEPESQPYTRVQLERLNPVKAGDRFATEAISAAIEALFDSGRFEDIAVDAALTPAGEVNLTFRTVPAWFIGGVSVIGAADPPSDGQLITAAKLELGQSFTEDYLIDATRNILASLRNNGFYRATVEPRFSYDPLTQQVQIDFRIAHGQRARFADPVFSGDHRRTAASLFRATNWQRAWG